MQQRLSSGVQPTAWARPADPKAEASFVICAGLILIWLYLPAHDPVIIFRTGAMVVGASLLLALLIEGRSGPRSLLRVDIFMLLALYGLAFLEFLFPQPGVATALSGQAARDGTAAVLLGFAGLAVGRHFKPRPTPGRPAFVSVHLRPNTVAFMFVGAFVVGYFHMLWAVSFNPVELFSQLLEPRFAQPWGRGRLGGWAALVHELGLLIYLLPPLAGSVIARRHEYQTGLVAIVSAGLAFVLFQSFASGTRNVFAVHVVTFSVAYLMFLPKLTFVRFAGVTLAASIVLFAAVHYMLEFRPVGLGKYLEEGATPPTEIETLFIDNNLVVISALTEAFPDRHGYIGLEIPYNALIHPIPRAIWPGKPEGLSVSIEQAVGASDTVTLAATFVGEAYMSGGYLTILAVSLVLGSLGACWNRLGQRAHTNFGVALYASGFCAAAIGMRSMLWLTVAVLPSLALWLYARWFLRRSYPPRGARTFEVNQHR